MTQSDTPEAPTPPQKARAKALPSGAPTLRQALAIIGATGVIAVVVGLLPRF